MVQPLSLLSWNVQRCGRGRSDRVLSVIEEQNADILTLQEATKVVVDGVRELGYQHQLLG